MYTSFSGGFLVFDEHQIPNHKRWKFGLENFRVLFLDVHHRKLMFCVKTGLI